MRILPGPASLTEGNKATDYDTYACSLEEERTANRRLAAWRKRQKEIVEEKESLIAIRDAFAKHRSTIVNIPIQVND